MDFVLPSIVGAEMTPEIWTILGTGITLAALGIGGFTLLWRYITRADPLLCASSARAPPGCDVRTRGSRVKMMIE